MTTIQFNKDTHTYLLNGIKVPSVTEIIKFSGLYDSGNCPEKLLNFGKERGTAIHLACEYLDKGILNICPEMIKPYLNAWVSFKELYKPEILCIEKIVYSEKLGYAGTLDRLVKINDRISILDIKSSFHKSNKYQLSAYLEAYNENNLIKADRRMVVELSKTGKFKVYDDMQLDDNNHDLTFQSFIQLLERFKNGN